MSEKGKLTFSKYKQLIFAIVIIIIVIILDIIFENYSKKSVKIIEGKVKKIYEIFEVNEKDYDVKELKKLSSSAIKDWEKRFDILACYMEHEEVEKINVNLKLLNCEIKNANWNDAITTTTETKENLKYLTSKYKFSLKNLF